MKVTLTDAWPPLLPPPRKRCICLGCCVWWVRKCVYVYACIKEVKIREEKNGCAPLQARSKWYIPVVFFFSQIFELSFVLKKQWIILVALLSPTLWPEFFKMLNFCNCVVFKGPWTYSCMVTIVHGTRGLLAVCPDSWQCI